MAAGEPSGCIPKAKRKSNKIRGARYGVEIHAFISDECHADIFWAEVSDGSELVRAFRKLQSIIKVLRNGEGKNTTDP